jgi:hypothetical protein
VGSGSGYRNVVITANDIPTLTVKKRLTDDDAIFAVVLLNPSENLRK